MQKFMKPKKRRNKKNKQQPAFKQLLQEFEGDPIMNRTFH
jgi:hypothetical protein